MTMTEFSEIGLEAANFKCFSEPQGFDTILPVNVIVGRNNSGKSTLLDLVQFATCPRNFSLLGHKGKAPQVFLTCPLKKGLIEKKIPDRRAEYRRGNYGVEFNPQPIARQHLAEKRVTCELRKDGSFGEASIEEPLPQFSHSEMILEWFRNALPQVIENPLQGRLFRRLAADRDIVPEAHSTVNELSENGQGATGLIERFLNDRSLSRDLIEEKLLGDLNSIFVPDADFQRILVQRDEQANTWEIFLEEETKGRIPMSQSGSGIKTVLLVLIHLLVIPYLRQQPLSSFIFGFEELENNLHPAIQRRLLLYLRRRAVEEKCTFFVTTHSNVVIDLFGKDEVAQILHMQHDGERATVTQVSSYLHGHNVIRDLGVKASDLLQSNAVVWVEGPSDRIYFNRWVELWSGGSLVEGIHYQCLPYGGALLAHLSFDDPEVVQEMVNSLRINRHAVVLMDSDKQKVEDDLKDRVQRVANEVNTCNGLAWISAGKEVENYIPAAVFQRLTGDGQLRGPGQFSSVVAGKYSTARRKTPIRASF